MTQYNTRCSKHELQKQQESHMPLFNKSKRCNDGLKWVLLIKRGPRWGAPIFHPIFCAEFGNSLLHYFLHCFQNVIGVLKVDPGREHIKTHEHIGSVFNSSTTPRVVINARYHHQGFHFDTCCCENDCVMIHSVTKLNVWCTEISVHVRHTAQNIFVFVLRQ